MVKKLKVNTGSSWLELHNPPKIPLIDVSKVLEKKELSKLIKKGLKSVMLSEKEMVEAENDIERVQGVKVLRKERSRIVIRIEKQRARWERTERTRGFGKFIPPDDEVLMTLKRYRAKLSKEKLNCIANLRKNNWRRAIMRKLRK